jgi:hypothetical protein
MSQLSCPDYPAPDVLFCHSHSVLVFVQLSCLICLVLAVMFWPSYPLCLVQADPTQIICLANLSRRKFPGCPVLAVMSRLSCMAVLHGCPVKVVQFQLSCPPAVLACHVLANLPSLSCHYCCPCCPLQLSCPRCPVLVVLSRL